MKPFINPDWEKHIEDCKIKNKMEPGLSWDECEERFKAVSICFDNHSLSTWDYFVKIYNEIPQEHRLKIQLLTIYTFYRFRLNPFYKYLKKSLKNETDEQRQERFLKNISELRNHIDDDNYLTVYRGINPVNNLPVDYALSYSISKDLAEWFMNRFESNHKKLIETRIHIDDVLFYTNDREEEEVIVKPPILGRI